MDVWRDVFTRVMIALGGAQKTAMTLSSDLWGANQDLAQACLEHLFVGGIASGTLPVSRFAYYIGQDRFFLQAFARANCVAAAIAPDSEGFEVLHTQAGGVLEELKLHQGYAAEWGADLGAVAPAPAPAPAPATRRYTDFLLATAWGADVGLTAAAMSPCMRLYAFLGQKLAEGGIPEYWYAGWIRTYSSSELEIRAKQLERLVDRYASGVPVAQSTYRYAMLCERDFFQAAWEFEGESGNRSQ